MRSLLPTTAQAASSGAELVTSDGRSLALTGARLAGELQGGLGRLVLEQSFHNGYDEQLKVTYRMPLPADGAVSGYEFAIGDRTIKGVVDRKRAARERFEHAIASGKTAALLEQERADIFTQQIGNIPPGATLVARITIDQRLVWLPEGEWELRFPTVIGPRYIGTADTAEDVRATHIKVTERPLGARVQIELAIRDAITAGAKPSSPSHTLDHRGDGTLALAHGSRLDRDIVVRWPVATPAVGLALASARPAKAGDAYGLLTIVPPARDAKPLAVPRDLIVLLDTSGSMGGGPLDKAKQVVAMMIDSLDEQDRLELIEFSNRPRRYQDEPVMATARGKQDAIKWVRSRHADGGTEMRAAVVEALQTL
ncbi:MAG: VIT domain-containing protein, partial [Acidobacteriota bacterium]